jgi:hypothetical protein
MDEREMRVEQQLVADLQGLAADIRSDLKSSPQPSIRGKRREQIAQMRRRIRRLKARHLGSAS